MPELGLMERLVSQIESLPPMPPSVLKLRRAIADPFANYDSLIAPIKDDPSLCADLLRVANSARYGVAHKVGTVEEAVRYFGMPGLVDFVSAACSERIVRQAFAEVSNLGDYLLHSRQTAKAASLVCPALGLDSAAQEAYSIAGLLHDIGKLVILLVLHERLYRRGEFRVSCEGLSPEIVDELELYGLNHAELGMRICERWRFPRRISEAVHRHHTPILQEGFSFDGFVIFLAELVSTDGVDERDVSRAVPKELMRRLGLSAERLLGVRDAYLVEAAKTA